MSRLETVRCDECGQTRGDSEGWLFLDVMTLDEPQALNPWPASSPWIRIGFVDPEDGYSRHDLCGQACFHRHLDKLIFLPQQHESAGGGHFAEDPARLIKEVFAQQAREDAQASMDQEAADILRKYDRLPA